MLDLNNQNAGQDLDPIETEDGLTLKGFYSMCMETDDRLPVDLSVFASLADIIDHLTSQSE
jgi:hypothetical protein